MVDSFTPERRSEIMSRIQAKNTKPEIVVRRYLHSRGLRFRLHDARLPGKPDLTLARYGVTVFVNGCFWHGHSCKDGRIPKTNVGYWTEKLRRNAARDRSNIRRLRAQGWRPIVIWGCQTTKENALERLADRILS